MQGRRSCVLRGAVTRDLDLGDDGRYPNEYKDRDEAAWVTLTKLRDERDGGGGQAGERSTSSQKAHFAVRGIKRTDAAWWISHASAGGRGRRDWLGDMCRRAASLAAFCNGMAPSPRLGAYHSLAVVPTRLPLPACGLDR